MECAVSQILTHFKGFFRALADVVVPVNCAGCGQWDIALCSQCWELCRPRNLTVSLIDSDDAFQGQADANTGASHSYMSDSTAGADEHNAASHTQTSGTEPESSARGITVLSLGAYAGELRQIVMTAKHASCHALFPFLNESGVTLGNGIMNMRMADTEIHRWTYSMREAWVIPCPSSWKRRMRGASVTRAIADGVARGIAQSQIYDRVRVVDCVRLKVGVRSQSKKSGSERRAARFGAMRTLITPDERTDIFIVDDVVTTGATIREVIRVLGKECSVVSVARA